MKSNYYPWLIARIFVGLVFAYAGFTKLTEPIENFRGAIAQYEIIPYDWITVIAFVMPWVEFLAGIFMMIGYAPRLSSFVLAANSLSFLIILGSSDALLDSAKTDCGCFGQNSFIHLTVRQVFLLDLTNFFLAIKLFSIKTHPLSLDQWLSSPKGTVKNP